MHTFHDFGRGLIHQMFRKDCCIDATAIVCDVLDHFGFTPLPMHCDLTVLNGAGQAWSKEHGRLPQSQAEIDDWNTRKGKLIQIRSDDSPKDANGYCGHVVTLCEIDGAMRLIDLTLDQCDRPEFGIALPPLLANVDEDFWEGDKPASYDIDDCYVGYVAYPYKRDFIESVGWRSSSRRKPLVRTLIRIAKSKTWQRNRPQ